MHKHEDNLRIYTLGRFKVQKGDEILTMDSQRSGKRWRLFQLLLTYRDQAVALDKMFDYLDLNETVNPREALKGLVYHLRQTLKGRGDTEQYIVNRGGLYTFNQNANYWLDAYQFEKLCKKADGLVLESVADAIKTYKEALVLYQGDYLVEAGPTGWALVARDRYRELYMRTMLKVNQLLIESERYEEAWDLCESGLKIDPFEASLHQLSIRSLIDAGKQGLARIQHEGAVALFKESGREIPAELYELDDLFKKNELQEEDPSGILSELRARRMEDGAFECGLQTFTAIYELEKGRSERRGPYVYLAHLWFAEGDSSEQLKQARKILREALKENLRKGDVVCNWSQRHFLILLESVNSEQVVQIIARSEEKFRAKFKNPEIVLDSRFREV